MTPEIGLAFFASCWLISLSPGPAAHTCMQLGLRLGYGRTLWHILGLQLGWALLIGVVAAGISAVFGASASAFNVLRWLGAAYLVWLALAQSGQDSSGPTATSAVLSSNRRLDLLMRGLLGNASNPKSILLMLALLPQFINPNAAQASQYIVFSASLLLSSFAVMSAYALLAARILPVLHAAPPQYKASSMFTGAWLLLSGLRRQ